jgi:hypothetical protein
VLLAELAFIRIDVVDVGGYGLMGKAELILV